MGKNLIQQKRGKGGPAYKAPSHRYAGDVKHRPFNKELCTGEVKDIIHCPGHSCPIALIRYEDGVSSMVIAPEGISVGLSVQCGTDAELKQGNTMPLSVVPDGTLVCNLESAPGDGGKFARSSGGFARVMTHSEKGVAVMLPSKKQRIFNPECRVTIGIAAGGGRTEKPFVKAGNKYHAMKARNRTWPVVNGAAMNALSHPFGGSRSSRKGRPTIVPRDAPAGRKVGMLRPKHVGRNK